MSALEAPDPLDLRLAKVEARLDQVRVDVRELRGELQAGFRDLRAELQAESRKLRADLQAGFLDLRAGLDALRDRIPSKLELRFLIATMVTVLGVALAMAWRVP
jgi:hypothetical protein